MASTPRAQDDLKQWKQWKAGGQEDDLNNLLDRFRGIIQKRVGAFAERTPISRAVLTAEGERLAVNAFKTYDPNRGTNLATWVTTGVKRMQRSVQTYQFGSRITESRAKDAGRYKATVERLTEELDREPAAQEVATAMSRPLRHVERLRSEVDSTMSADQLPGEITFSQGEDREMALMLRAELTGEEQLVFDYTTGTGGKPLTEKPEQIAKMSGIPIARVYQLRASISRRLRKYVG